MGHSTHDRTWITSFFDSALDWWGESWYDGDNLQERLELVQLLCGKEKKHILELGAGTGETAFFLNKHDYPVTAVDLSKKNTDHIANVAQHLKNLVVINGDFLEIQLEQKFDIVCLFECFGYGSDNDQRRLLQRIANEWLTDNGCAIIDVYHPYGPIKNAGRVQKLDRLPDVAGSVDMTVYEEYDSLHGRWINTWVPVENPENARTQSIRCYTPSDLLLLLETTGLAVENIVSNTTAVEWDTSEVRSELPFSDFENTFSYTVKLIKNIHKL